MTCPACGLANEAGARTCRNCGLPIASATDPVRGVSPGRVDLPRTHKSGLSATIGFVMVIVLLFAGGSLAFSGGGGLLGSGGRFFDNATPTPTAATAGVTDPEPGASIDPDATEPPPAKASKPNMDTYVCGPGAIRDLSRGRWFLTDVQAGPRTDEEGGAYDQVYWRLDRQGEGRVNAQKATRVTMRRTTPDDARERFGDSIDRLSGEVVLIITFDGPVSITAGYSIEREELEGADIDQIRRIQMFEKNGKVHTVIGLRGESCARLGSVGWGAKSTREKTRVVLDIERFEG